MLVAEAGEGVCEISITDPNGQLVPNQVTNDMGILSVAFVPTVNGVHRGTVLFNKQNVPGTNTGFLSVSHNRITESKSDIFLPIYVLLGFRISIYFLGDRQKQS